MKFVVRVKLEEGFGKGPAEMEIICRDNRTGHALHSLIQFPWAALVAADGMGGAPATVMKKGIYPVASIHSNHASFAMVTSGTHTHPILKTRAC
jgi:hypothetical protein